MTLDSVLYREPTATVSARPIESANGHPRLNSDRPKGPDPALVAAKAQEFIAFEATHGGHAFAEELVVEILLAPEPDPVELAALRSEEVAFLAWNATKYLLDHSGAVLRSRRRGSRAALSTERFRAAINRENRIFKQVVDGTRAKRGILPNERNVRRRAERRLVQENLKGDVPKGRFIEIYREEQELADQIARDQKRARAEARKKRRREKDR